MALAQQPPPGAFFLRHISGTSGRFIAAGQAFVRGGSYWTHAGVVLDNDQIIQGQPGGAVILPLSVIMDGSPVLFSDKPIQDDVARYAATYSGLRTAGYEGAIRRYVVQKARALEHVKYSYLDYPVLALAEWAHAHHRDAQITDWLRDYVQRSGHMICSALVDDAYLLAGIHLFDDGRFPCDVTPQDLADYANPL